METKDVHAIKYKMSKAKERCMAHFCSFQSNLQVLLKDDLKGTRIEHGFKRAFMSLFGQDDNTFTSMMFLNVDQLQKQLEKDEFQEDGSMTAFWPKKPRNAAWYKEKETLAEAQEARQILDEEQLAFLANPGVLDGQAIQTIIPNTATFQTEDLDTYDSDCDDLSNAKAVLMTNISNYGSNVISEDKEEVFDEEEVTHVKVLMAVADNELTVGKSHARNGE
nr:hypothetical protein [Tanacetum cinerariifolium]